MSMNLYAEDKKGKKVELWQTPTWITYLCFNTHDNKQREWKDTLFIYTEWVKSHLQGVWDSNEEYEDMKREIDDHIHELQLYKLLHFYIM